MKVKVATSQFKAIKGDFDANLNKAISLVEKASNENVDILLLQELFQDYSDQLKNLGEFGFQVNTSYVVSNLGEISGILEKIEKMRDTESKNSNED